MALTSLSRIACSDHGVHKLPCPPPPFDFSLPLCPPPSRDYASFNAKPISPNILTSLLLQLLDPAERHLEILLVYTIHPHPFTSLDHQKPSSTSTLAPRQATTSPCDRRSNRLLTIHRRHNSSRLGCCLALQNPGPRCRR